jgi:hypothetical protein
MARIGRRMEAIRLVGLRGTTFRAGLQVPSMQIASMAGRVMQ